MTRNDGHGGARFRHLLPLGCALLLAGSALLGACSRSTVQAPRQTPEQMMAAQVEALKQENEALRAEQQESSRQIETLNKQIATDRDEQKKFRQMMSTNFDLLEQSVSLTLAKSVEKSPADKSGDPNKPVPSAPGASGAMGKVPTSSVVPSTTARMGLKDEPAPASDSILNTNAVGMTSAAGAAVKPVATAARAKSGAGKATPAGAVAAPAGDQDAALNDPDLQPPKKPKQLTANRAAKPLYERGFTLYGNGQYEQAIIVYQNFLTRYPQDIYSDNAQFWIGESYLQMNKLDEAEAAYRKVLREYEHKSTLDGYKTPDAIYRLGTLMAKRHKGKRARQYLEVVAQRFPDSSAGHKAQRELEGNGPLAQAGDISPAKGG